MSLARCAFPSISVAGRPPVLLCLDLDAVDEVNPWLLEHDWIDEPVQRAFLDSVRPGGRVIDLGSHLGVFSLPAAALGAEVLAVDASPRHVAQVELAAVRNGFSERYHAVWGACTDADHPVAFFEDSIHGHVVTPDEELPEIGRLLEVPSVQVDDVLDVLGWEHVDVIKLDIEGGELAALRGMSRLFARGCRPVLVFESNGMMLPLYGGSTYDLKEVVTRLGYELLVVDHLRPGLLVEATPEAVQPEAVTDYLALPSGGPEPAAGWSIEPPFGRDALAMRMGDQAVNDPAEFRQYVAGVLHDGPGWLRDHPLLVALGETFVRDGDPRVRDAFARGARPPAAVADVVAPAAEAELPPEVRVWAADVDFLPREPGLEPPPGIAPPSRRRTSFHAGAGQLVGVLGPSELTFALVRGLAGELAPAAGRFRVSAKTLGLSELGRLCEPGLSAAENVVVITTQLGGDPRMVDVGEVCRAAGLDADTLAPLRERGTSAAAGLALLVALDIPDIEVLMLGELPRFEDDTVGEGIRARMLTRRREDGLAVVQAISVPEQILDRPDRMVWLTPGGTAFAGHPGSIADAFWRRRLGLPEVPIDLEPALPLGRER